jgi:hypothetical protein
MPTTNRLRTWAATAVLALAALSQAQQQPKVTMTMAATKLSNVAAEIKKQTGVQITCNPTVANIPVLVSVTDVPLDQLLAKLAQVTGGEVLTQSEGFLLSKSDKLRTDESTKETGWIVAAFERAKKRMAATPSTAPDRWDEKTLSDLVTRAQKTREEMAARLSNVQRQQGAQITMFDSSATSSTPASGSARKALELLPSSVLASIKPGERVVYSSTPNRMQRRMPINLTQIVNDFVYNHNLLAKAAPQLAPTPGVNIVGGLFAGDPIQNVAETHLILSRGYRSTTVSVEIKFADRNGLYVGQGQYSITPEYAPAQPSTTEEGTKIQISELSRQMAVIMAQEMAAPSSDRMAYTVSTVGAGGANFITVGSGSDTLPKQVPDELLNVFVNPDRYDPTSLYVSECFIQAAKAEGKDLVAAFPDTIVRDLARTLVKGNVTHKAILGSSASLGLTIDSATEWMVVTPTWANAARNTRFDRDQAAKLFRAVHGRGFAFLEELADYSFHVTIGLAERSLDTVYLALINKDVGDQLTQYVSMSLDLLQLYATVPENMKRQSGEKMQLAYRTLTPQGRQLADHAYYARPTGFMMPQIAGGGQFSAVMMTMETTTGGRPMPPANSVLNEPTEALPNGIPGEALVNIDRTMQEAVFATTKGIRGGQMLSAQELGMRQGIVDANFAGGTPPPQHDTFQPAQVLQVMVTLDLGDYGRPSAYFKDAWLITGSRPMAYNQLPEGFRAQVDQAKKQFMSPPMPTEVGRAVRVRGGGGG